MTTPTNVRDRGMLPILNRALVLLQLPPAMTLTHSTMTDQMIVHDHLLLVHRMVGEKGWYCFNREDRLVPHWSGNVWTISDPVWSVRKTTRLPADPEWENVRVIPNPGFGLVLRGVGGTTLTQASPVRVDVAQALDLWNAPEAYIEVVVRRTVRELAPGFGVQFDPQTEQQAVSALEALEYQCEPGANMAHDAPETFLTWFRH